MGYMRVEMGSNLLGLEGEVAWVTPKTWTEQNFPCFEDGKNCDSGDDKFQFSTAFYKDPSLELTSVDRKLAADMDKVQRKLRRVK